MQTYIQIADRESHKHKQPEDIPLLQEPMDLWAT